MVCTLSHYTHLIEKTILRLTRNRKSSRAMKFIEKKVQIARVRRLFSCSPPQLCISLVIFAFFFGRFFILASTRRRWNSCTIFLFFHSHFFLHTRSAPLAAAHRPIINEFPPIRTLSNDWSRSDMSHGTDVREFRPKLCGKLSTYIEKKRKKTPHNSFSLRIWTFLACGYIRNDRVGLRCERDRLVIFFSYVIWILFGFRLGISTIYSWENELDENYFTWSRYDSWHGSSRKSDNAPRCHRRPWACAWSWTGRSGAVVLGSLVRTWGYGMAFDGSWRHGSCRMDTCCRTLVLMI